MRISKLLVLVPALALALAGCKEEGVEGPLAACQPVSFASSCSSDAECCSFGCVMGSCIANPLEGGVCKTHGDCAGGRLCIAQRCSSAISCVPSFGACTAGVPCCNGTCTVGGYCPMDNPPVAVPGRTTAANPAPIRIPIQLTNASYDPDVAGSGVGLAYTWSVVAPSGSTATFQPSASYSAPRFTPDVAGTYTITLRAQNAGGWDDTSISFQAVNTAPVVVSMPPDVLGTTYQSRNVPLAFSASVADDDGGPVSCTWAKKGPSAIDYTIVSGPTTCAGASGARATGTTSFTLLEDEAGTWEVQLSLDDGANPVVTRSRFISVQNDSPVANAGPMRYGNHGLGAIPLNGTATDINFDVVNLTSSDATFTWRWTVSTAPGGSGQAGIEIGTTPSVSFTPDRPGTYTLTLTVDDGHGGPNGDSDSADVQVQVDPYILPLGEVADAEYVDVANRIVLVETDAGNAYRLKIVDPATLDVDYVVTLAARPTTLALNPLQTEAVVGIDGARFQRITGIQATPAVATTVPATPGVALEANLVDIAHAGACVYGVSAGGAAYRLDPSASVAPYWWNASCPTCSSTDAPGGTRAAAATTTVAGASVPAPHLWLLNTSSGRLGRWEIHGNCDLRSALIKSPTDNTLQGTAGLWLSADAADLYSTRTSVYDAVSSTLATRVTTPLTATPDHVDTTLTTTLVGAIAQRGTGSLQKFTRSAVGSQFQAGSAATYPILGHNGDRKTNYGVFGFVRSDGGEYYAIVRADVGTTTPVWKWGLVNLGP